MIKTFADCKYRQEDLRTRDEVLSGNDWAAGLCPNSCPLSLRNSDYSRCDHPKAPVTAQPACRLGGEMVGSGLFGSHPFCEALVAAKHCPKHYVR